MFDQIGNKTDCALLAFASDLGGDYALIRKTAKAEQRVVKSFPFHSARKRAGVVLKKKQQGQDAITGSQRIYVKGASEMVLGLCSKMLANGQTGEELELELTQADRTRIEGVISEFANQAMRTICLAYRDLAPGEEVAGEEGAQGATEVVPVEELQRTPGAETLAASGIDVYRVETELTLLGLVGIEDPLREEVPGAIARCRKAGVDVRMVTGDNLETAIAIAKGCNILRTGEDLDENTGEPLPMRAMTGPEFRKKVLMGSTGKIDQVAFDEIWPHLRVLARSSPTDKYTLVSGLMESELYGTERGKQLGIFPDKQVVAVTGDGTNDAPALKKADIGFAMGITGTQVAKDAADIILMDDNFSSIVKACMWGRKVYESISKFLQFQLTINIVAISVAITGAIASSDSPIRPVQMLWINLIMDSLASLALATEPPNEGLLERAPFGRNASLIKGEMWWNMIGHAIYQYGVLVVVMFKGAEWLDIESGMSGGRLAAPTQHYSIIFNAFVLMQLVNQFNMHKLHHELNPFTGFFSNPTFVLIELLELAGQVLIMFFGGNWFRITPIDAEHWLLCIVLALLEFPVQALIVLAKRLADRHSRRRSKATAAVVPEDENDAEPEQAHRHKNLNEPQGIIAQVLSSAGEAVVKMRSQQRSASFGDVTLAARLTTSAGKRKDEAAFVQAAMAYRQNSKKLA